MLWRNWYGGPVVHNITKSPMNTRFNMMKLVLCIVLCRFNCVVHYWVTPLRSEECIIVSENHYCFYFSTNTPQIEAIDLSIIKHMCTHYTILTELDWISLLACVGVWLLVLLRTEQHLYQIISIIKSKFVHEGMHLVLKCLFHCHCSSRLMSGDHNCF